MPEICLFILTVIIPILNSSLNVNQKIKSFAVMSYHSLPSASLRLLLAQGRPQLVSTAGTSPWARDTRVESLFSPRQQHRAASSGLPQGQGSGGTPCHMRAQVGSSPLWWRHILSSPLTQRQPPGLRWDSYSSGFRRGSCLCEEPSDAVSLSLPPCFQFV